jgi:intracellular sulfur oxidation DsrE/DsrF family protein
MTQFAKLLVGMVLLAAMPSLTAVAQEKAAPDKIVVQVNEDDPKGMNLALNNVQNLLSFYKDKGEKVEIEVVAFGPGLQMLRQDTSPVKDRISHISKANPEVQFSACNNTMTNMTKQEGATPPIVSEAKVVASGVVRIVELQ